MANKKKRSKGPRKLKDLGSRTVAEGKASKVKGGDPRLLSFGGTPTLMTSTSAQRGMSSGG